MDRQTSDALDRNYRLAVPGAALCVGDVAGSPVATALLLATGRVAGIFWVATLEGQRRKGYGEALTFAAVEAGREFDCTLASLQASEMGLPVYARMGFEHATHYVAFERPTS
jgi:GNAT superfamily N-acetyltransferase